MTDYSGARMAIILSLSAIGHSLSFSRRSRLLAFAFSLFFADCQRKENCIRRELTIPTEAVFR